MDNPYQEIDDEDLRRFRAGLPPLVRKEFTVEALPINKVLKDATAIFAQQSLKAKQ